MCVGIDLNSKFEIEPGLKDVEKVKAFVRGLSPRPLP
jgi:phosphoribosylanthranilate isomerase